MMAATMQSGARPHAYGPHDAHANYGPPYAQPTYNGQPPTKGQVSAHTYPFSPPNASAYGPAEAHRRG